MSTLRGVAAVISLSFLTIVIAAPGRVSRSAVPLWHAPCGSVEELEVASAVSYEDAIRVNLESIKLQHRLALDDYLNRDYEYLYERVRIGVHDHQYIPNWVPGKKDVHAIKRLHSASSQTIISHLPKLHLDLQKFAVAFEELIEDESNSKIQEALGVTQSYLTMMLCEVENSLSILPAVNIPDRVERSIMSSTERNPVDDTRRLIRDWGVLLKYKDYLHAWRHVFNY